MHDFADAVPACMLLVFLEAVLLRLTDFASSAKVTTISNNLVCMI